MKKIIMAFAFLFLSLASFATGTANAPQTNAVDPITAQAEKVANLLESKGENLPAKESKKLEQLKKKWSKIKEQAKKSPNRADLGGLLVKIGIILIIIGVVAIAFQLLGVGALGISGGGAIILGLILYLIGKYAF